VHGLGKLDDGFSIDSFLVDFDVTAMHRYIPWVTKRCVRRRRALSGQVLFLPLALSGDYSDGLCDRGAVSLMKINSGMTFESVI
jgi:hypothetical protein